MELNTRLPYKRTYSVETATILIQSALNLYKPGWEHSFEGKFFFREINTAILTVVKILIKDNNRSNIEKIECITLGEIIASICNVLVTYKENFNRNSFNVVLILISTLIDQKVIPNEVTHRISMILQMEKSILN